MIRKSPRDSLFDPIKCFFHFTDKRKAIGEKDWKILIGLRNLAKSGSFQYFLDPMTIATQRSLEEFAEVRK